MSSFRSPYAWMLFAVLLIAQMTLLSLGTDFVVGRLTNDDTYYYLQTVWNAHHLGFVTFDGLHKTSGVQFLWFGVLYVVSWMTSSKEAFLFATLALCFVLNALCVFPIVSIGRKLDRPLLGFALALGWTATVFSTRYWLGLENSLHALVLWLLVLEMAEAFFARPRWTILGLLWLANVWTRIDGAVFCAGMAVVVFVVHMRTPNPVGGIFQRLLRGAVPLAMIMIPGGLLYAAVSYWMGGAILPVSVVVKTAQGLEPLHGLARLAHRLACDAPPLMPFQYESRATMVALWIAGFVAFGSTCLLSLRSRAYSLARPYLLSVTALCCGWLLYHTIAWIQNIQYADYCTWHRSPSYILGLLLLCSPFCLIDEESALPHRRTGWALRALALVAVSVFCIHRFTGTIEFPYERHVWHIRHQAARWIDHNLPKDVRLGAWNAGEIGYFSNREVINLDGLVNDIDYARNVVIRGDSLVSYLASNRVDYLVDYLDGICVRNDLKIETLPILKNFDRGGGNPISIWKFIPPQ